MLRQIKPKTARSKRALDERAPKLVEDAKRAVFVQTSTCNETTKRILNDLATLKKPDCQSFSRKKDNGQILPFEDAQTVEFFSEKNDAAFIVLGSHSKKRPHNLTICRTFDYKVLDVLELGVENVKLLADFPKVKCNIGIRPLMCFCGPLFEEHESFRVFKSLLVDLYRGREIKTIDAVSLQHVLVFSHGEASETALLPPIHMRGYLVRAHRTGQKLPRVELDEMGPSFDFRIRRLQPADEAMLKEALRQPTKQKPKAKKNIDTDSVGDKVAQVHVGRQDLTALQTRKFKGLKRGPADVDDDDEGGVLGLDDDEDDIVSEDDGDEDEESAPVQKRARR